MSLPWRGPGPGRPELPLPPDKLPIRRDGHWRKRWRYVGAFGDELLLCAARINVGPLGQTFWAIWDRTSAGSGSGPPPDAGSPRRRLDRGPGGRRPRPPQRRRGVGRPDRSQAPGGGRGPGLPSLRRPRSGSRRSARPPTASTSGRESAWTCPSNATSGSRGVASRPRPGASRTSPRATTRTTRSGAGRPVSARQPTGDRSAGTSSAASTIRQSSPSGHLGRRRADRARAGRVRRTGGDPLRRGLAPRLRRRVRATAGGEPLRRPLHVPTAAGRFLGDPAGGHHAQSGLGVMEHHDAHW